MRESKPTRFTAARVAFIAILCIAIAVAVWLALRLRTDVDAELAAIDAAHVIPTGENAADDYATLARDPATPAPDSKVLPANVQTLTLTQPWRNVDLPQAVQWLQANQAVMIALLRISAKPKCWFPVSDVNRPEVKYFYMEYEGTMLLLRAANNDLGEGRSQEALEKLLAALRIVAHLRAQAHPSEQLTGWEVGQRVMEQFSRIVLTQDVPEDWLVRLEAAMPSVEDTLEEDCRKTDKITNLYVSKRQGTGGRLLYILDQVIHSRKDIIRSYQRRYLAESRAAHIALALRRHYNAAGIWPVDLSAIETTLPPDAFTDPLSGRRFVYQRTDSSFSLYSPGPNGIDEGGVSGDDHPFWPR